MSEQWMHQYGRAGAAPIVFLHGFMGSARSVEPLLPHLGDRLVLAPHLPGHHPQAPVSPTFASNVDWLADSLRAAGVERAHVVGYSLGARTALGLGLEAPDLVGRLTLIGVHPGLAGPAERAERVRVDLERAEQLRRDGLEAFVRHWEALPLFATQTADQRDAQRAIRLGHTVDGLYASLRHMGLGAMPDYGARCGELAMPTAVVAGARDDRFVELGRQLCSRWPALAWGTLPGAGHNAVLEAPACVGRLISAS